MSLPSGRAPSSHRTEPHLLLSHTHTPPPAAEFGSTLAREQAFDDERWRSRLLNPQARTFIARDDDDDDNDDEDEKKRRRIISSVTLLGPSPAPEGLTSRIGPGRAAAVPRWELNGVFTLPGARRRGAAAAVVRAAQAYALGAGGGGGGGCLLTAVVYAANGGAKLWYEEMGFEAHREGEDQGRPTSELALFLPRAG